MKFTTRRGGTFWHGALVLLAFVAWGQRGEAAPLADDPTLGNEELAESDDIAALLRSASELASGSEIEAMISGGEDDRLQQLERELATIRHRLDERDAVQPASFEAMGCDLGSCGSDCGCGCVTRSACSCADSCCVSPGGWFAGYAFVFAKPHYKESFQATHTDVVSQRMDLIPFEFDYELAPKVWLGYINECGRGLQAQYWNYDHDANDYSAVGTATDFYGAQSITVVVPAAISTLAPGDVLNVSNSLRFQTLDVEGLQRYHLGGSQFTFSGGLRAAFVEQDFFATVSRGGGVIQSLRTFRSFEGLGPTIGANALVPTGARNLFFTGNFRAALLYGEKTIGRVVTPAQPIPPTTTPDISTVVLDDADEVFGGGAVELGMLWTRCTPGGKWFMQGGYSGELWTEAGAPTLTFLGFEGFSLSAGLLR